MRILKAFTEADKDVEVLVFPGEHHWLQGKTFSRWQRALRDFFREHLPPEPQ
jgi:dipeptidyl aminopeptidase/acylaminoacyl peptidase